MIVTTKLDQDMADYIVRVVLEDPKVKGAIAKQIRQETATTRNKYSQYDRASFDALTYGDVNLQYRLAQSGEFYGHTILSSQKDTSNKNTYKHLKNKIIYGKSPTNAYTNKPGFNGR